MKICYVSAFYNLNRENWGNFKRSYQEYVAGFLPMIDLIKRDGQSEAVIFLDTRVEIPEQLNNNDRITVIPLTNEFMNSLHCWSTLNKEREIMNSEMYKKLVSHRVKYPEHHIPEYTLINHSKVDFVEKAIQMKPEIDYFCWFDFGFFINRTKIPNNLLDLNKFNLQKVTYTLVKPYTSMFGNVLYNLELAPECFQGNFFFGHKNKLLEYRNVYHSVLDQFQNKYNIADDDQHISVIVYSKFPNLIDACYVGEWHTAFKHFQKSDSNLMIVGDPTYLNYTFHGLQKLAKQFTNVFISAVRENDRIAFLGDNVQYKILDKNIQRTKEQMYGSKKQDNYSLWKLLIEQFPIPENCVYIDFNSIIHTDLSNKLSGLWCPEYWNVEQILGQANTLETTQLQSLKYTHTDLPTVYSFLFPDKIKFIDEIDQLNTTEHSRVVCVCSTVHVKYERTILSNRERFFETLAQVKSLRENIENVYIVVLEATQLQIDELAQLYPYVDRLYLFTRDEKAQYYTHEDPNKNKTEVYTMLRFLQKYNELKCSHVCKFGARYSLSNQFDSQQFFREKPVFSHVPETLTWCSQPIMCSVFYSIPQDYIEKYVNSLVKMLEILHEKFTDVERLLYQFMGDEYIDIPQIGILGYFAGNPSVIRRI